MDRTSIGTSGSQITGITHLTQAETEILDLGRERVQLGEIRQLSSVGEICEIYKL